MIVIEADSEDAVSQTIQDGQTVEIQGGGSKLSLGRPVRAERRLSLSRHSGITLYEHSELVMSAKSGTPLPLIEATLRAQGQCLAFEPPDLSRLLGNQAVPTIGGVVATNLSGPRRPVAGAVRDHVLGLRAVNGRGEIFRAGGRVVKNVTGYDLCKLLTGSFGTMAVFTEVTFKVLPAPESEQTVLVHGPDPQMAVAVMSQAMGSSAGISAAAYQPGADPVVSLRLEGFAASVLARRQRLELVTAGRGDMEWREDEGSASHWRDIRDVVALAGLPGHAVWKLSVAASQTAALLEKLARIEDCQTLVDWGGALVWARIPCGHDAQASLIRGLLPEDGYGWLMVAPEDVRANQPVFHPRPGAQAAVEDRVRQSFDPMGLLNPGRMAPPC